MISTVPDKEEKPVGAYHPNISVKMDPKNMPSVSPDTYTAVETIMAGHKGAFFSPGRCAQGLAHRGIVLCEECGGLTVNVWVWRLRKVLKFALGVN